MHTMLHIGYLLVCEEVIKEPDRTLLKPLASLSPLGLPGNYSFKVAFSLHNLNKDDFGKLNKINLIIEDQQGNTIINTGSLNLVSDLETVPNNARIELVEADITINNAEFQTSGIYTITLIVNDERKEVKIPVMEKNKLGDNNERNRN